MYQKSQKLSIRHPEQPPIIKLDKEIRKIQKKKIVKSIENDPNSF